VELLVVISIIGILIALLLPAVQAAREAARIAQCQNNVKQLALGCLHHESVTKRFPTGGWGFAYTGDPDRGNDWRQPGGWIYNILPFVEQQALHDRGAGQKLGSNQKLFAGTEMVSTPITYLNCPTRRRAIVYPWASSYSWYGFSSNLLSPLSPEWPHPLVARSDYAACVGDYWTMPQWPNPVQSSFSGPSAALNSEGGYLYIDPPTGHDAQTVMRTAALGTAWPQGYPGPAGANGVSFALSMIKASDVTDGLSNTFLVGEKNLCPDNYETGEDGSDDEWALQGFDGDNFRCANDLSNCPGCSGDGSPIGPQPDTPGYAYSSSFGSAHLAGFNMALCDGSVRMVNYTIDVTTYSHLCNRHDGQAIDARKAF
jgi:type II secretory pathway pseudopilin PulG